MASSRRKSAMGAMPSDAVKKLTGQVHEHKPNLPALDPVAAELEAGRNAMEGNRKLSMAVDGMRTALETIVIAEMDNATGVPVTLRDLKSIATQALDEYSRMTGQSWRRHKIIGSWAGDRSPVQDG